MNCLDRFNQLYYLLNEFIDLKNLWMTSPDLWNSNERRLLCYLQLNKSKSKEYLESEDFRAYIISRVTISNKQISLNLSRCFEITDVSSLGNVHALDLAGCSGITDVSSLVNVHDLDLSGCDRISDVSSLGNVHTLDLLME